MQAAQLLRFVGPIGERVQPDKSASFIRRLQLPLTNATRAAGLGKCARENNKNSLDDDDLWCSLFNAYRCVLQLYTTSRLSALDEIALGAEVVQFV